jgi:hypothetical protein
MLSSGFSKKWTGYIPALTAGNKTCKRLKEVLLSNVMLG